jgi:hypothetical protein
MKKKIKYFVTYYWQNKTQRGFGRCDILRGRIMCGDDIGETED